MAAGESMDWKMRLSDRNDATSNSRWIRARVQVHLASVCKRSEKDFFGSLVFFLTSTTIFFTRDCYKSSERGNKPGRRWEGAYMDIDDAARMPTYLRTSSYCGYSQLIRDSPHLRNEENTLEYVTYIMLKMKQGQRV